jgi:hypothetical protein
MAKPWERHGNPMRSGRTGVYFFDNQYIYKVKAPAATQRGLLPLLVKQLRHSFAGSDLLVYFVLFLLFFE